MIKHTEDNQSVLRTPQLYTSRHGLLEQAPQWVPVYDWYRTHGFSIAASNMKDIMRSGHRPQGLLQLLERSVTT
ncbi:hypothetical protein UFOVP568_18 [uncultured Caudovirales phage]|uniref:Uncharacterized protein n=1 Tax=uncultured Caudovirales phage TaxID=2100421 RepID=A0A6J5MT57_9CAUD|nr:hypothetical protein UFOVP568_18 [uncultured Caudovirales phage]